MGQEPGRVLVFFLTSRFALVGIYVTREPGDPPMWIRREELTDGSGLQDFDAMAPGYEAGSTCDGVQFGDDATDSLHFCYGHDSGRLTRWRL